MLNVIYNNVNIWGIVSIIQNNVERIHTVKCFEYEGEIDNPNYVINTWKFKKYDMGLVLLSQVMLAIYSYSDKFNVIIYVYGDEVIINLELLNRKDD